MIPCEEELEPGLKHIHTIRTAVRKTREKNAVTTATLKRAEVQSHRCGRGRTINTGGGEGSS